MARILLTWELGGGLGHLMNLRPLAGEFVARGHQVFLALRELSQVRAIFAGLPLTLLAAPWKSRPTQRIDSVATYAHMLLNVGFGDEDSLASHVDAWRSLFALIQPDLLIADHSPTALLAAKGERFLVATVGTGFFCPPDETPLRFLRDVASEAVASAREHEERLLNHINAVLVSRSLPTIERVTQLYHDSRTRHYLLTFPELDHFLGRRDGDYRGPCPFGLRGEPIERAATGPAMFVYLKPIPALEKFLSQLGALRISSTVFVDGLQANQKAKLRSPRVRFASGPVDIGDAAQHCDLAVTNANPGTCTAMLLAGKPVVSVPGNLEQLLFAGAIERLGASITANANDAAGIIAAIQHVLTNPSYSISAGEFASRHEKDQLDQIAPRITDELEQLIS